MQDLNKPVLTFERRNKRKREEDDAPKTAPFPPRSGNRILAGYLAHQFLTKGALSEAAPVKTAAELDSRRRQNYLEVASLLQEDGIHIPGIVNPAQLCKWIQL